MLFATEPASRPSYLQRFLSRKLDRIHTHKPRRPADEETEREREGDRAREREGESVREKENQEKEKEKEKEREREEKRARRVAQTEFRSRQ